MQNPLNKLIFGTALALALPASAMATPSITADGNNSQYLLVNDDPYLPKYQAAADYTGVGVVYSRLKSGGGYVCTGSLVGGNTVLTAGHCINQNAQNNGQIWEEKSWFILGDKLAQDNGDPNAWKFFEFDTRLSVQHEDYNQFDNDFGAPGDIGMIYLDETPDAGTYDRYGINWDTSDAVFGQDVTHVGAGSTGNGASGKTGFDFDFRLRAGKNRYDLDTGILTGTTLGQQMFYDFDDGTFDHNFVCIYTFLYVTGDFSLCDDGFGTRGLDENGDPLLGDEAFIGSGDSGGPSFINGLITGVHSWGGTFGSGFTDVDDLLNSSFGEYASDTRVAFYQDWYNEHLDNPVPAPGMLSLFGLSLLGFGIAARRRRK